MAETHLTLSLGLTQITEGQAEFPVTTPPTNARIRDFLKAQQQKPGRKESGNASGDGSNDGGRQQSRDENDSSGSGDEQRQQDNQSPPPNCSICLGRVKSKCFTDSCMHQFCFSCLLEWSKIKPECPLCKQAFKSIIHNVTSMDNYEEYKVENRPQHASWINIPNIQPLDIILTATLPTLRNVYRPEVVAHSRIFNLFLHDSPLTERFARMYPQDNIPPRHSGAPWRSYVYQRKLYAMPLSDINERRRIITAEFYRDNPAQIQRLMPWLNRELISLALASTQFTIGQLLRAIDNLIQQHDMTSRQFRRRVHDYVPENTEHFIHELVNFARSPYDMVGYDRNVMYQPVFNDNINNVVVHVYSSDESDVIATEPIQQPPATVLPVAAQSVITENRSIVSLLGESSSSSSSQQSTSGGGSGGGSSSGSGGGPSVERKPVITTNTDTSTLATVIESSSDSSDVFISNEGSAFASINWRSIVNNASASTSGQEQEQITRPKSRQANSAEVQSNEQPTLIWSSSEDESEEVSAYSQNQAAGGPTFDSTGGRISPNTLRNSGRSVIVSVNFGGASSIAMGETPTTDAPSGSETNATPCCEAPVAPTAQATTIPPEVAQTIQVVTSNVEDEPQSLAETTIGGPGGYQLQKVNILQRTDEQTSLPQLQPPSTATSSLPNIIDESDSDEVQFVCARKPPHLRTPEYVELNSESDSDVVFVNEEKLPIQPPIKLETQIDQSLWSIEMDEAVLSGLQLQPIIAQPETSSKQIKFSITNKQPNSCRPLRKRSCYGVTDAMWNSPSSGFYDNPVSSNQTIRSEDTIESQPSTSSSIPGHRRRKYPRYLKSYIHSNAFEDDTDSNDSEIPLKRLIYKPKKKEKTMFEASSSANSTGPDSTDEAETSSSASCSSDGDLSSSSHEEFSVPAQRVTKQRKAATPTKKPKAKTKKTAAAKSETAKTKRGKKKTKRVKKSKNGKKRTKSSARGSDVEGSAKKSGGRSKANSKTDSTSSESESEA